MLESLSRILKPTGTTALMSMLSMAGGLATGTAAAAPPRSLDLSSTPATAPSNRVLTGTLGDDPHLVDVYKTAGARRVIVLLHGGGGNKVSIAYQLGMNTSDSEATTATVNWKWLKDNKVMLVLPQGQNIPAEPNATTWRNYAMDSGQDDVAYLQALAARIRSATGLADITLMGHSMGGVMTNRMWCESPTTFNAYVSLAGPASSTFNRAATPCQPGDAAKPYLGIIGTQDEVMQTAGAWWANTWKVNQILVLSSRKAWDNDVVIGEFRQQQTRTALVCQASLDQEAYVREGNVDTWSSCNGQLQLKRVTGAEHAITSIDDKMGDSPTDVMDTAMAFIKSQPGS